MIAVEETMRRKQQISMQDLGSILVALRGNKGCPWDKEQTHESMKPYLIEEAYEVLAAIDSGDQARLKEELGDLLFQVAFHAQLAQEQGHFDIYDVLRAICLKMIERHPHVFSKANIGNLKEGLAAWERLKAENRNTAEVESYRFQSRHAIPSLLRAYLDLRKAVRLEKTALVGKQICEQATLVLSQISKLIELDDRENDAEKRELVMEALFSVAKLATALDINSEEALQCRIDRFHELGIEDDEESGDDKSNK